MIKCKHTLKQFVLIVFGLFSPAFFFAQNSKTEVDFSIYFGDSLLKLERYYPLGKSDSIQITSVKFYLSAFELWLDDKLVWKEDNKFRLLDLSSKNTMQFNLNSNKPLIFNTVKFNLGIDSLTNVSGALGGDLDPTRGMYWTWQSGYINFKLEGNSNLCKTRHNEFVFHLGGFQSPNLGMQPVKLKIKNKNMINLILNIKDVLDSIDLVDHNHIMSPGKEAVILSEKTAKAIKVN